MGLGYVLAEEVHIKAGRLLDTNLKTYGTQRFSWLPALEKGVRYLTSDQLVAGGEPAIVVVVAAVAGSAFDTVGASALRVPMAPERVRAAMPPR